MKIKWQDKISNKELLKRANMKRLSEEVRRRRWRFIGHILRQQPDNDCVTGHLARFGSSCAKKPSSLSSDQ